MTDKDAALELIARLPDEVSTETIVAELQFKLLIERRREQARAGAVISHEQAVKRLQAWLESSGR